MLGIFKKNRNFPNYMVSDNGEVYSIKRQKFLKPRKDKDGYLRFNLYNNKKCKTIKLHQLVAMTFLNNPNNYPVVNHIDGNKLNNSVDNLEFCTIEYNNQHAFDSGLNESAKNFFKNFKKDDIKHLNSELKEIFDDIFINSNNLTLRQIGNKYNLSRNYISSIKRHKTCRVALQEYFNGSKDS